MLLPALYHWSPTERRVEILRDGLKPYSAAVLHSLGNFPYVCLSPTPSSAWSMSGDMEWASEIESWDLWQVRLNEHDEVHVRAEFGNRIVEVRVRNSIAAERLWYVATREPLVALNEDGTPVILED